MNIRTPVIVSIVATLIVVAVIYFLALILAGNVPHGGAIVVALALTPLLFLAIGAVGYSLHKTKMPAVNPPHPFIHILILIVAMLGLRHIIGRVSEASDHYFLFPIPELALVLGSAGLLAGLSGLLKEHGIMVRRLASYREQNIRYERIVQERESNVEVSRTRSEAEMIRISSQLVQVKDFARKIGAASDEDEIFRIIHDSAVMILDVEKSCFLAAKETESGISLRTVAPPRGWSEAEIAAAIHKIPHPFEQVIKEKRIYVRMRERDGGSVTTLATADPLHASYIQPMVHGHRLFGMLILSEPKKADVRQASAIFSILGDLGGIALENAAIVHRIREQAIKDGLTGLHNHRFFQDYLTKALEEEQVVTMVLSDIDHFKKFNDTYGHQTGDAVLRRVAQLALEVLQKEVGDVPGAALLARYGGEEFVMVLPGRSESAGAEIAEAVRLRLASTVLEHDGKCHSITLSLGVASASSLEEKNELIRRADEAMYGSKQAGRNRLTVDRRRNSACDGASAAVAALL